MSDTNTTIDKPTSLLRVNRPYHNSYKQTLDEPENTPANPETGTEASATQTTDPELSPEDKVYKSRYDSLKAHYDKTVVEDRKRIAELKTQLSQASVTTKAMPKTANELAAWRNQYPDLYGMLITAVRQELKDQEDRLNIRVSEVETASAEAKRARAEASLLRLHPDLPELLVDDNFHKWVQQQPVTIQQGLYENSDDYLLAARYIDMYKMEMGLKTGQRKTNSRQELRSAAQSVNPSRGNVVDNELPEGKIWKVSDIKKLNRKQFEQFEDEIDKARAEGRLVQD